MTFTNLTLRIWLSGALFILILLAGWILHRLGRPFNQWIFNLHKIATVIWVILMVTVLIQIFKLPGPGIYSLISAGISVVALLALLLSGGMMSLDKMQETMLAVHRISSVIMLISYPVLFAIMLKMNQ